VQDASDVTIHATSPGVVRLTRRRLETVIYTVVALIAFAANSILCRMALGPGSVDAATFSIVRVLSGAVTLLAISARMRGSALPVGGSWTAAALLVVYGFPFAFAYNQLSAGTGALILFGCVQMTMPFAALMSGERPHVLQWIGLFVALGGLAYLVSPGLTAPSPTGAALMAIAGVAWGAYSLAGLGGVNPLAQTTGNFVRAVPLVSLAGLMFLPRLHVEPRGILLSVASGAITSGLGYVAWYAAVRGLTAMRASVVQLAVPVIAAVGGVLLLSETITLRLLLSSVLVLGGIAMAIVARQRRDA
jgi:drug/metabolite transporter (DMT)-like permease